jgi:hypothetical protein
MELIGREGGDGEACLRKLQKFERHGNLVRRILEENTLPISSVHTRMCGYLQYMYIEAMKPSLQTRINCRYSSIVSTFLINTNSVAFNLRANYTD